MSSKLFPSLGGPSGTQPPLASYLLDDPTALPFGTRLRNFLAADNSQDCLLFAKNPLRVRVPHVILDLQTRALQNNPVNCFAARESLRAENEQHLAKFEAVFTTVKKDLPTQNKTPNGVFALEEPNDLDAPRIIQKCIIIFM